MSAVVDVRHWISARRKVYLRFDCDGSTAGTLNARLHQWKPETADQVCERVTEIIGLADQDALDLPRAMACEQDVLDILDAPSPR